MQAMVLAAGFGTRLLPHTKIRPKPLFPILNIPLLQLTIERLQNNGFDHILVNCHHLKDQICSRLSEIDGVAVIPEESILGTGGGLRKALPLMRKEPLLVTNGDVYHTIDFNQLYHFHKNSGDEVTLAMHDYPRFNNVCVSGDHIAHFNKDEVGEMLAFTGLHVVNPQILESIPHGRQSCIIDHYRHLLQKGIKIQVARVDDCFWTDMGTPEDYLDLHGGLLTGEIPLWQEITTCSDSFCVDERARLDGNCACIDWCAVGQVSAENVTLRRVVVWDGVTLPEGSEYSDVLISHTPSSKS